MAWDGMAWLGVTVARDDKAWLGMTWLEVTMTMWLGMAWLGVTWHGVTMWLGVTWHRVTTWLRLPRHGVTCCASRCHGTARGSGRLGVLAVTRCTPG